MKEITDGVCSECGGSLRIAYFINPETKRPEPDYGVCMGCLKEFTVSG